MISSTPKVPPVSALDIMLVIRHTAYPLFSRASDQIPGHLPGHLFV
jgi:hypothetical protein